jgi:endonuclease YncB( thermonuclease family)
MQNTIEIQLNSVIITFIASASALILAGYFTLRRRLVLAVVSMGCFLLLFNPTTAMSSELCKPIKYADGDTFNFKRDGELVRVRLAGYDAPEVGQPFSRQASDHLRMLTMDGSLCDCYKEDRHGRSVCTVRTLAGANVAPLMLGAGYGCIDPRFEHEAKPVDRAQARAALEDAQARKLGMWSGINPQCAAEFRREQRNARGM